jgi:transcriptional regulator with XRE-family HTH domain
MMNDQFKNELMPLRRTLGLTRKQVAIMLGYQGTSTIARIERGSLIPPLPTLLKLEILYRRPLGYLYPTLYSSLRDCVRAAEAAVQKPVETPEDGAHA